MPSDLRGRLSVSDRERPFLTPVNDTASGHHLLGRAPFGLPRGSPGWQGSPTGSFEVSPCRPGGSGVGLCLAVRGDDPFASPSLREGRGAGQRPAIETDGFTVRRRVVSDVALICG